ncbi:tRNA pseudouridine synthase A, partial [Yersinia pestis PY-52]
MSGFELDQ